MSNFLIALMFTAGVGTWVYNKLMRQTGNNTKSSVMTAIILGFMIFVVFYLLLGMINPSSPRHAL